MYRLSVLQALVAAAVFHWSVRGAAAELPSLQATWKYSAHQPDALPGSTVSTNTPLELKLPRKLMAREDTELELLEESSRGDGGGSVKGSGDMDRSGELTYYGGAGKGGACTQTLVPDGFETVAMNNEDYGKGDMCGTCVHACWTNEETGEGERCINAIVDNKCPECLKGDLDLGENGSGRWPVQWKVIPCPTASKLVVSAQGSNAYYAKLKVEGGPSAVASMKCGGASGSKTDDAFFEFNDGSGKMGCGMDCELQFSEGGKASMHVEGSVIGSGC